MTWSSDCHCDGHIVTQSKEQNQIHGLYSFYFVLQRNMYITIVTIRVDHYYYSMNRLNFVPIAVICLIHHMQNDAADVNHNLLKAAILYFCF